ncbi:MAG TPA: sugar-binding protein [Draconibacterium sp.]|nr:sugar-binding protein [Draconibacterium sp.]
MRKIFTLILGVLFVSAAFAQLERPRAVIKKAEVKPVIDGVFDEVWATTDSFAIDRPYDTANGAPTLGEPGETYWKALWDEDGYYLIVKVTDDAYYPNYLHEGGGDAWMYDKPEIYFDVNYVLEDGLGPSVSGSGHHQMAPDMTAAKENGQLNTEDNTRQHAFKVDAPNYVAEYFVPWASLTNSDGGGVDLEAEIGFDVSINDSDPDNNTRRRGVWANVGPDATEAWSNMDQCGIITLEGAQVIYVEEINISVDGAITEDNQQLQVNVEVLPADATNKSLKWKVRKADPNDMTPVRATISPSGLITPVINEELIIYASDGTDFIDSEEITVSITGQSVTKSEVSYIKNGNFDVVTETGAPGAPWSGGSTVVDGVLNITNTNGQGVNPWDWTVGQNINIPASVKDEPFVLQLKMWISEPDTFDIDIELIGDDYLRFGNTPDPHSADGRSQWRFELTTEPTMYTLEITDFSGMDTRAQKFNLFAGLTNATVSIDSISLVSVADLALVSTGISQKKALESFKVYPNPATSKLNVELSAINSRVEIYNSVGVKMDEAVVFGNRHSFDVSAYAKGLYFVKANGVVVKFIK